MKFENEHIQTEGWCQRQNCSEPKVLQNASKSTSPSTITFKIRMLKVMTSTLAKTSFFLAKYVLVALSQLRDALHFCFKNLENVILGYVVKIKTKI